MNAISYPKVIVNGIELNSAQSMVVHVALQSYAHHLAETKDPLGDDEHGKFMTKAYLQRISEINQIIIRG